MTAPDPTDIEEYLAGVDGRRAEELRLLHSVIRTSAPGFAPVLVESGGAPLLGYGLLPYKSKSMKQPSEWPVVSLAPRKNYVSLYISAVIDGRYVPEIHADRLGKVSCGKSCIRFKRLTDLNLDAIGEILADLEKRWRAGEKLYGEH
ncbi:DUF1801 domain-containing protein [Nocardia bovistercoris]|uniref:DUF1801 domain-containing protein n=1 Tax=Nocardia bovistercoris TaxID=2785916 RepID=A0A931N0Z9_9NOCA|nr:DUF1801 domain-containing protein [Nocardia bovistercoris]MBH0775177.1 DUF1801 domain-containing protein [Nocardia bovistercoris]